MNPRTYLGSPEVEMLSDFQENGFKTAQAEQGQWKLNTFRSPGLMGLGSVLTVKLAPRVLCPA